MLKEFEDTSELHIEKQLQILKNIRNLHNSHSYIDSTEYGLVFGYFDSKENGDIITKSKAFKSLPKDKKKSEENSIDFVIAQMSKDWPQKKIDLESNNETDPQIRVKEIARQYQHSIIN